VTFFARGAQLAALRERGLTVRSPLGDFTVHAPATGDPADVPPVDVALYAVKTYSNADALPALAVVARGGAAALTLQNGVDSVDEVSSAIGAFRVLGGATYVAAALTAPGLIEQTGTHRRIVFGEITGAHDVVSERVQRIHDAFAGADIESEPVADAHLAIWEKFCYLAPFASFTSAARLPIGPLWADPLSHEMIVAAVGEVADVGRSEGHLIPFDIPDRVAAYIDGIPPTTRSSMLIDLQQGKPLEVEALTGAVVRRGRRRGIATPIAAALYSVLRPHAHGRPDANRQM
jgi:2-dehydropantoate 2-reductase